AGVRRLPARLRKLPDQSILDADDSAAVHWLVDRRSSVPHGPGPDHRCQVALAGLATRSPGLPVAGTMEASCDGADPVHAAQPSPQQRGVDADGYRIPRAFAGSESRPRASGCRRRSGKRGDSMKVSVDLDTCDGNGVCMSICHEVFDVQADGLHLLQEEPPAELRDKLKGAEVSCPTQAITVKD